MRPYRVWHVGRAGEVAGGMTQVINGYLAWDFPRTQVGVLSSRDGSAGPRAVALVARAVARIAVLPARERSLVVVHLSQRGSFVREGLLLLLARLRGFATVAHVHGSAFPGFARRHPHLVRTVLGAADAVFVLTEVTATAVRDLGVPLDRIHRVVNAVPPADPAPRHPRLLFGGAVSTRKGVDLLVQAWRRVGADGRWSLDLAGPVTDPDLVPADLPYATVHGAVDHDALLAMLAGSEVAVLPSRDEALPVFVLEALAREVCVVAAEVGGLGEALADGAGVLVPPGDADALTDALARVLGDDDYRRTVAAAGARRFAECYSAAAVYPALEELWIELIGTGRAARRRAATTPTAPSRNG